MLVNIIKKIIYRTVDISINKKKKVMNCDGDIKFHLLERRYCQ